MGNDTKNDSNLRGFIAVARTAVSRMQTFAVMPGFDKTGPAADLQTQLKKTGDWKGYEVRLNKNGELRLKGVRAKA